MVWINASTRLPDDHEEVLIRVETIVHLAVYDESENIFRLRNGEVINPVSHRVQWMRLTAPEPKSQPGG
jgi:hypothetical protein